MDWIKRLDEILTTLHHLNAPAFGLSERDRTQLDAAALLLRAVLDRAIAERAAFLEAKRGT